MRGQWKGSGEGQSGNEEIRKWKDLLFCCKLYPPHNLLASMLQSKPCHQQNHLARAPGFTYNFSTGIRARKSAHHFGASPLAGQLT